MTEPNGFVTVRLGRWLGLAFSIFGATGCYVLKQAYHQNNLINSRRPAVEVVADPATPRPLKNKLQAVDDILTYAEEAGLAASGAYRYVVELDGSAVSYLVQAAEVDQLKFKTWWFPIVGEVPYLGFFRKASRDEKAADLRELGYDVRTGGAAAFSSLGFFEDPIFTSMLRRSHANLARLLFHELTHRTLWLGNNVRFNENLAEYVGRFLTRRYLKDRQQVGDLEAFEADLKDRGKLRLWLAKLKKELQVLYKNRGPGTNLPALLRRKHEIFSRYQREPLKPVFAGRDLIGRELWNNADVLAVSLYSPDFERFRTAHLCFGIARPIGEFLEALDRAFDQTEEGFKALDSLCGKQ